MIQRREHATRGVMLHESEPVATRGWSWPDGSGLIQMQHILFEINIDVKRLQEIQAHQPARVKSIRLQTREFDRAGFQIGGFRVSHFERVQLHQSYISFFGDTLAALVHRPAFDRCR